MKTNCLGHRRVCLSREKAFACETVEYMYRYSDISAQILYVSRHSPAVDLTIENNAVMGYTAIQIYSQFPDYINSLEERQNAIVLCVRCHTAYT